MAPSANEIVEHAERVDYDREKALAEARRVRMSDRTRRELAARVDALQAAVDVLEEHLAVREALAAAISKPPVIKYKRTGKGDPVIPVAISTDEHYDETFTLAQTGGHNEQNPEIAEEKVATFVRRLIRLVEREALDNPIPALVMPMLGDMMTGELHAKDERSSGMTPVEAARFAYRLKRRIIDCLLDQDIPKIIIPCIDGNHGRTTAKRTPGLNQRYSHETDVYLRLADHYIEAGERRIEFYVPQADFGVIPICDGFRLCFTHGDAVTYWGGVGGLFPSLLRSVGRWRQSNPAEWYICGHHHQYVESGAATVAPCAVGYNPYAYSRGLDPGEFPRGAQLFTTIHTGRRQRATTCPIWLA